MTSLKPDSNAILKNRKTVASYERCALEYAKSTAPQGSSTSGNVLRCFVQELEPRSSVLEIGSGPGWDADVLEAQGVRVRRTDITENFLAFQQKRGKAAEYLDAIADELGRPYDGIVALYVLQHIDRSLIPAILEKVAGALRQDGVFLVSLQEGTGELCQISDSSGIFHITLWTLETFTIQLNAVGLQTQWVEHSTDNEGDWITVLAKK